MKALRCWAAMGLMVAACVCGRAAEKAPLPKPTTRTTRNIEGWTVRIDDRLLRAPDEALGARAIRLLETQLQNIKDVMAADRVARLQAVPIVLDLTHGQLRSMQYHPSREWLVGHGYAADLAKCVHIPYAADFVDGRHNNEQPCVVLHELSHAYHDQVLDFEEPRILAAYEKFKASGHGDSTLHISGRKTRHYALTDQKEFFAEMSEAYFGVNDFFPFNRAELKTAEPEIYALLETIWDPPFRARGGEKPSPASGQGQHLDRAHSPQRQ